MSEIGQGRGSSYPNGLDTNNSLEQNDVTRARAEVPNDLASCIIAVQTELGTNPAGLCATVVSRLNGNDTLTSGICAAVLVLDQAILELEETMEGLSYKEINIPAGAWNYPATNPAPLDRDTGANGGMFRQLFDDSTEEFILLEPAFELPDNLDPAGTVYFSLFGYAVAADGNEVQFRLSHSARDLGESWDNAYVTEDSGDYATDAVQDRLDQIEWNETIGNLGWAAQDLVRIMLSRIAIVGGVPVVGDYGVCNLKIRIPIT